MKKILLVTTFLYTAFAFGELKSNAVFTYVLLKTSMGEIHMKLNNKEAPKTIEHFKGLITGKKTFRDLKTGKKVKKNSLL